MPRESPGSFRTRGTDADGVVDADGKKHFKSEKSNPTCEMCIIRAAGFGMERMLGRAYNVTAKNIGYIPSHAHNVSKSPKKGRNP